MRVPLALLVAGVMVGVGAGMQANAVGCSLALMEAPDHSYAEATRSCGFYVSMEAILLIGSGCVVLGAAAAGRSPRRWLLACAGVGVFVVAVGATGPFGVVVAVVGVWFAVVRARHGLAVLGAPVPDPMQ